MGLVSESRFEDTNRGLNNANTRASNKNKHHRLTRPKKTVNVQCVGNLRRVSIKQVISECSKLGQKDYKHRHDWFRKKIQKTGIEKELIWHKMEELIEKKQMQNYMKFYCPNWPWV